VVLVASSLGLFTNVSDNAIKSFSAFDVFCDSACKLAGGANIADLGEEVTSFNTRIPLRPTIDDSTLTGSIIYIDSYQNAVTNISRELFEKVAKNALKMGKSIPEIIELTGLTKAQIEKLK
jgi:S-adenosylmethionine hydrolase